MTHQPIKLSENLSLYSGDVITLNHSEPLLVEVIDEQKIKLRKIDTSKYLYQSRNFLKPLRFSSKTDKALIFILRADNNRVSLQAEDSKYLEIDDKKSSLSVQENWLTIVKKGNLENIGDYQETIESINLHKDQIKTIADKKIIIACKSYDNKTKNDLEYNFAFTESVQKESNLSWSKEFTLGSEAKLSIPLLEGLELGGKLERKHSNSNSITEIETKTIEESLRVNCSPWVKTRVRLEVTKAKIITPFTAKVKRGIGSKTYEYLLDGELISDNYSETRCSAEELTVKNILIVGWTGSGKSTLAKVLSQDDVFQNSSGSVSGTKFAQSSKEFEHQESYYCVIDNIGFGDAKVKEKQVMLRIGEAINSAYQGLSHVLFVFDNRFTEKEKQSLEKLSALKIADHYITLVRSKFENFGTESARVNDRNNMESESSEISELINNCRGFLHINNEDDDSKEESRTLILGHLRNNCEKNPFKPKEWENIVGLIEEYFKKREELEKQKKQALAENKEVINQIDQEIEELEDNTNEQVEKEFQGHDMQELKQLIEVVETKWIYSTN